MQFVHLKKIFFIKAGFVLIGFLIFLNDGDRYHFGVLLSSFFIALYAYLQMLRLDGMPFSLNKIFYIFILFFIGLAPALQYKNSIAMWGAELLTEYDYLRMNLIFILILIFYSLLYSYFSNYNHIRFTGISKKNSYRIPIAKGKLKIALLFLSVVSFAIVLYARNFNIISLLFRGGGGGSANIALASPLGLIVNIFLRPIPVISLIVYRLINRKFDFFEFILVILVILSNAPTGMPRFQAAALYIPVAITYTRSFQRNINFSLFISSGLLIVFPLLNIFRRMTTLDISRVGYDNLLLRWDFDTYHNFAHLLNNQMITYGRQLAGALLFFMPRRIWADKPIGSSHQFAEEMDMIFSNISMNYFAEGYINFGYFGILLFIFLIAYINGSLDRIYWKGGAGIYIRIVYLFLLGMLFFLLRGDMMSSFAYTIGIVAAIYFVYILVFKKIYY